MRLNLYFIIILLASFTCITTLKAQAPVPNGGFENWTNAGASNEEPTNWNSNKTGSSTAQLGPQTCFREGSAHTGSYCVKMETRNYLGQAVNGSCTTGRIEAPTFTPSDGYIQTVIGNTNHSYPFTSRPDSLVGWYKYTKAGSSAADITVNLHTGAGALPENGQYQGSTSANVVGRAKITISVSATGWTRFSVPFVYVNANTPAYFLCAMNAGGVSGAILRVDDLEVIYNPALTTGAVAVGPYYVAATVGSSISVPFTAAGIGGSNTFTAQLSNASGSFASPVNIGTLAGAASGTINATIPAGTASGTGYRIRVVSSNPTITAADNGTNITINLANTSIAPATVQTVATNTPGNQLTVTESAGAVSREWKYATISGGPYLSFNPAATGITFTPQFATAGTYYVVAQSTYPGSLVATSNEVVFTVAGNSIAPSSSQSILVGATGDLLTVTETPAATSREWKYATTPGGTYLSFSPTQTGTTYAPVFNTGGNYYVVAQSVINGVTVTSNEVEVSVSTVNLVTGTITPASFFFSPSAPSVQVTVPFTTTSTFTNGNVFTAQLSDANGSFASPTNIGTLTGGVSGTITGTIVSSTPVGTGYRIRVVSSSPVVNGSNNGTDLLVDQFNNSITPATTQTYTVGSTGTALTINESQTASREWKFATVSGGPYSSFSPPQTGATYTPNFSTIGTYYVIATSQNQYSDLVTSNEVEVIVVNGTTLTTTAVSNTTYYVSPRSNETVTVDFTTDIVFNGGNTFTAELSDATGDFTSPVVIGTATTGTSISAVIPSNTLGGTGYRIRVVSTSPATVGTDNGTDLSVIPFEIAVTPKDTQNLFINEVGTAVTITSTHPAATHEWLGSGNSGFGYGPLTPAETGTTYTPTFATIGNRYIITRSINQWGDTLTTSEFVIVVTKEVGINETTASNIKAYWNNNDLVIDLGGSMLENPTLQLFDMTGKLVVEQSLETNTLNRIGTQLPSGMYILQFTGSNQRFNAKTMKQ